MKGIYLMFALMFAAVLWQGAGPASAATLSEAQILAQTPIPANDVLKIGDSDRSYDSRRRHKDDADDEDDEDDDDDKDSSSLHRRITSHLHSRFCDVCRRRCSDGDCPPPCSRWVRIYHCRY